MQEEKNKQVIREFTRIFKNQHNVDGVGHLFDGNFVHHFRGPMPSGFEGLRQVGIMMNGAFPDVVVIEEDLLASGDRVVERSSATATHKGAMMGTPPTNKRIKWSETRPAKRGLGRSDTSVNAGFSPLTRPRVCWLVWKNLIA